MPTTVGRTAEVLLSQSGVTELPKLLRRQRHQAGSPEIVDPKVWLMLWESKLI
jgi:hypothetical protein